MIDEKWEDWAEPLKVLLAKADEFLSQIDFSDYPKGGQLVEGRELHTRKEVLADAFRGFMEDTLVGDFLEHYIYVASVYEDVYGFAFEYIGESEHQMALHGDEFPQTKEALLEDFALYVGNWQSPYWRNLE